MNTTTPRKKVAKRAAMAVCTLVAALAVGAGGFYFGSQSSWIANSAYQNGYSQASYNFCNLKFTTGANSTPYTDDIRTYEYVPKDVLVADAVCTDDQVKAWNAAQESNGSPERACKLDLNATVLMGTLAAAQCIAPESLN